MHLWLVFTLLGLIKLLVASLMLWLPFRSDAAMSALNDDNGSEPDSDDDDGGSRALPGAPLDPHPRRPLPHSPRRGPHGSGSPSPRSPARVRTRGRRVMTGVHVGRR